MGEYGEAGEATASAEVLASGEPRADATGDGCAEAGSGGANAFGGRCTCEGVGRFSLSLSVELRRKSPNHLDRAYHILREGTKVSD